MPGRQRKLILAFLGNVSEQLPLQCALPSLYEGRAISRKVIDEDLSATVELKVFFGLELDGGNVIGKLGVALVFVDRPIYFCGRVFFMQFQRHVFGVIAVRAVKAGKKDRVLFDG